MLRYGTFGTAKTQHVIVADRDGTPRLLCAHWTTQPLKMSNQPFDDLPHCKMCQYMLGHQKRLFLTISQAAHSMLTEIPNALDGLTAWAEYAAVTYSSEDWANLIERLAIHNAVSVLSELTRQEAA